MAGPTRTLKGLALGGLLLATALGNSGCWWWKAQAEGQLAQDLRILAPSRPGATWTMRVTENERTKGEVVFRETSRFPEAGGFRLLISRAFVENGETGRPDTAELSQLFAPQSVDMRRGHGPDGSVELVAQGPLRLGMPTPTGERAARLVAVQALALPYGRIPWAAALERRAEEGPPGPEGDRVATAWFAPGMGLVRFDEGRSGRPFMSAQLTHFTLP